MAPRRSNEPAKSVAVIIYALSAAVAVAGIYYGLPGLVAPYLGVLIAAIAEPPAVFTGPRVAGRPTPAGPWEEKAARDYDIARDMKWRLLVPNTDWLPGWAPRASWFVGLAAAVLSTLAPVASPDFAPYWWLVPLTVAVLVWQVTGTRRRLMWPLDPSPGVRVSTLLTAGPGAWGTGIAAAVVAAGILQYVMTQPVVAEFISTPLPTPLYPLAAGVLGFVAGAMPKWSPAALAQWRELVSVREEWDVRWSVLFKAGEEKPRLLEHRSVGRLTVDTFAAPATVGSAGMFKFGPKFQQAVGSGLDATILNVPATNSQGQPMPGTAHPLNFDVVSFPAGDVPNIADPATTVEEASYLVTAAMAKASDSFGSTVARNGLLSCQPLHQVAAEVEGDDSEQKGALQSLLARLMPKKKAAPDEQPDIDHELSAHPSDEHGDLISEEDEADESSDPGASPAAWVLQYQGVGNVAGDVRSLYAPIMVEHLGIEVLADERKGLVFAGALTDPATIFTPQPSPVPRDDWATYLSNLSEEDTWNFRWSQALKQGANPPEPQFNVKREGRIGGATLYHQPFVTKQGIDWTAEYQGKESVLATTLAAAPFVSVVGFQAQNGKPGERHPQAFAVRWSDKPVPTSVDRLTPTEAARNNHSTVNLPHHWVIAGMVNAAFDKARLPRPEVYATRPMTTARSTRGHIWRIDIRLHGGVTIAHIRGMIGKIITSMGVPWLRIAPGKDAATATIVAGVHFNSARLANPDQLSYLIDLDWQQAFADSGVTGVGGMLPRMLGSELSPHNQKVHILDFELPAGVAVDDVKKGLPKLKGATKNAYAQVQPGVHGPASIRMLVSEEDPMPLTASVRLEDLHETSSLTVVPFATGVEGSTITWDLVRDPHLLITGTTGSGKSAASVTLLGSLLRRGVDVVVADPTKDAADFRWAEPWLSAMTITVEETAAMMDAVYTEVKRRKKLNGQYGVVNYTELPEEVRPRPLVVYLDEFTSLIMTEKVSKPATDNPEALADYHEALAHNALIAKIGDRTGRIAREARSAGVSLVLAAQELKSKTLESVPGGETLRGQMSRLALGKMSYGNLMAALKQPDDAPPLGEVVPQGRGVFETNGNPTVAVQVWYDHPIDEFFTAVLTEHVEQVPAEHKIDLAPFMPKKEEQVIEGEIIDGPPKRSSRSAKEPVVIDAGSLELSLEDLDTFAEEFEEDTGEPAGFGAPEATTALPDDDDDDDDLDWSSIGLAGDQTRQQESLGGDEATPADLAAPPLSQSAVLVLDVEGVVVSSAPTDHPQWGPPTMVEPGGLGPAATWAELVTSLAGPWAVLWLSHWGSRAAEVLGHLISSKSLEHAQDETGWKLASLRSALSSGAQKVVWVDPQAHEELALGLTMADLAHDIATEEGVDLHVLVPAGPVLSREEVAQVRKTLAPAPAPFGTEVGASHPTAPQSAPPAAPEVEVEVEPSEPSADPDPGGDLFAAVPTYRLPDPFAD